MGRCNDVELDDLELRTPRLLLRRWRADDAERVWQIMRDRSMFEFLALPDPYTREVATEFVTTTGHEGRDTGAGLGCAMVEPDTGRVVGSIALRLGDDPELGYWVAPDARGHGYAAEASAVLAELGFEQLGLARVGLACDVRNVTSARTALAAGFRFEGVTRGAVTAPGHGGAATRHGELAQFGRLADDDGEPVAHGYPPLPAGGLADEQISLRVMAGDDAEALAATEDDPMTRAVSFHSEVTPARTWRRTAERAGLDWLVGGAGNLAIVDRATGAFAGSVTLRHAGPPQIIGIGYAVHPSFRGRGYTARALRLIAPWAFAHGFARLELGAKVANVASQRAALAAGFAPDGVRRHRLRNPDGTFADEARFVLLPPDYSAGSSESADAVAGTSSPNLIRP